MSRQHFHLSECALAFCGASLLFCLGAPIAAAATATPDSKADIARMQRSTTTYADQTFIIPAARKTGRLDAGPVQRAWQPGDPIKYVPKRAYPVTPLGDPINPTKWTVDPLLDLQQGVALRGDPLFGTTSVNIAGNAFSGAFPPDTVGDVGATQYVQAINASGGTSVGIWDKDGNLLLGSINLAAALGAGVCATAAGDPVILYDHLAERWVLSEFADGANALCVYVSQSPDAAGTYFSYVFTTPNFPDYPKYAVWPDAYLVTSNESGPGAIYVLDRAKMLTGAAVTAQRLTVPDLAGFGFQALTPVDLDGPAPPAGADALLVRHRDDEVHNPGSNNPAQDFIELYEVNIDFVGTSSVTGPTNIAISEFDSNLCGLTSFMCFPQPNGQQLDPLREVVMWRASYRNFGNRQTILGNLVTDVDGTDHGGVRWFELRNNGGGWTLFQEGTHSLDANNRWMGSIAMDESGNIALGYSVVSLSQSAEMRYAGRLDDDPLGTLPVSEFTIAAGGGSQTAERWGDYSAMSVDPVDGCTFWHTNEYVPPGNQWQTRIAAFRFNDCGVPPGFCGDNVVGPGEQCDDGNTNNGDGCSATCQIEGNLVTCENEQFENGLGPDYVVFNTGALPLNFGTTDDGFCFSNNLGGPPAPNVTGGNGEAACADSDAAGSGIVQAYLCGPAVTPNGPQVTLAFNYNFQVFSLTGEDNFSVLVGTAPPGPATIGSYTTEFSVGDSMGGFAALPGVPESLDLSAYAGQQIHYCFRYSGDFDWYAQVDDVVLQAQNGCGGLPDTDGDGVPDITDNCTAVVNPGQQDSNGDSIGNICDGDITGPGGIEDCLVNFLDLQGMKDAFFSNPASPNWNPHADFDSSGLINFLDLQILKNQFFGPPGPSANGCN